MARNFMGRALGVLAIAALAFPIAALAASDVSPQQQAWEARVGRQRYAQLMQTGEIVAPQSPLYATLRPVTDRIAAVANRQYFAPFHFFLVNDQTPNAYSIPGGNVYLTTAMLSMLKNRDELAGVLCHEVNHDIHHDVYNAYQQHLQPQSGPGAANPAQASFARAAETNADRAGAYTCAKAGFNPWGMVWNFRLTRGMGIEHAGGTPLSDHPSDEQRVGDLVALFARDPETFGRFRDDIAASTLLAMPSGLQTAQQSPPGYGPPQGYAPQGYPSQGQYPTYPPPQGPPPGYGYPSQGQYPTYPPPQGPPPGYGYPSQGQYPTYPPPQGPPPGYSPPG
jgi:Zn-dependent protease with chaperone function